MSVGEGIKLDRRELLVTTAGIAALVLTCPLLATSREPGSFDLRRGHSFDLGWRFSREGGDGLEATAYDDSQWREVDLPHDWRIEDLPVFPDDPDRIRGPFDRDAKNGTYPGFTIGGQGWYRKHFRLTEPRPGRCEIAFEGVYMNSDVWINGHLLGNQPNGYTPFSYDLTPFLSPTGDNLIAVRVRDIDTFARWYPGSGIYRHVWLDVLPRSARLARWGAAVITRGIEHGSADIEIETELVDTHTGLTLVSQVLDAAGRTIWMETRPAASLVRQACHIGDARLWSAEAPHLYMLVSELRSGPTVLDHLETPFGVRIITFDAARGMAVNGVPTKLRGGCIHHDHGILGAAAFDMAEERKVALLKARGFNALRPSHNLFSPAFLRACDRLGMMVICETFDSWLDPKFPNDYSNYFNRTWQSDLRAIVRSARNHPSIIMWSIGNEIPGRYKPEGMQMQWQIANEVRRLDCTRAVTAALNGFAGHEAIAAEGTTRKESGRGRGRAGWLFLDVAGYNYKLADYERDHARFPEQVFMGTESFAKDIFAIWELTDRLNWLIGDFVWVAMDYLGEASMGFAKWPWVNAYSGDLDITGTQKPQSLARDVAWGLSKLELAVQRPDKQTIGNAIGPWGWPDELPSWNWPGAEHKPLTVRIYTAGNEVELILNGRTLEKRPVSANNMKSIAIEVPYAPGTLEAVAFRDGREIARRRIETVGPAVAIRLTPERFGGGGAHCDVSYIGLELVDARGRLVPDAEVQLDVAVHGAGVLAAFGSADPLASGSYQSGTTKSWRGRALIVIRGTGKTGRAVIQADGPGFPSVSASLQLEAGSSDG
jgi:beta-galactosidase